MSRHFLPERAAGKGCRDWERVHPVFVAPWRAERPLCGWSASAGSSPRAPNRHAISVFSRAAGFVRRLIAVYYVLNAGPVAQLVRAADS
jgi:hypothetical protein